MDRGYTRRLFLAASSLLVVGTLTAANAPTAGAADYPIDEIRWALPAINDTMFVPRAWSTYVGAIMSLVQEGLAGIRRRSVARPRRRDDSGSRSIRLTYKYTLRKGVTFGDGSPLTPDDVVATFQYHMNPKSGSQLAAFFSSVASVEATGDDEVTVKLKAPNVQFRTRPRTWPASSSRRNSSRNCRGHRHARSAAARHRPLQLVEFSPADRVVLEARDDYWGPKPVASGSYSRLFPTGRRGCLPCRTATSTAPSTSPSPTSSNGRRSATSI